jgi:hypothetical protein
MTTTEEALETEAATDDPNKLEPVIGELIVKNDRTQGPGTQP